MRPIDMERLRSQMEALRQEHPEVWEDQDLRELSIESETDLHGVMNDLAERSEDDEANSAAVGIRLKSLEHRKKRFEARCEALRKVMYTALELAGLRKVELPIATISLRAGQRKVVITNEDALPDDLVTITRKPDKLAIKERLVNGEAVPGAELSNAEDYLNVRTS